MSLAGVFWSNYENCPQGCSVVGQTPIRDLEWCHEPMLFDLGLHTPLSRPDSRDITIRACAVTDPSPTETRSLRAREDPRHDTAPATHHSSPHTAICGSSDTSPEHNSVDVHVAWGCPADADGPDAAAASENLIRYLEAEASCASTVMLAQSGKAVVVLYVGS